jgi:hypothetical protein
MKKMIEQKQMTRSRVKRCRDKQATSGRVRVELYLDQTTLDAVDRYADELGQYRSATLTEMILTGLCL